MCQRQTKISCVASSSWRLMLTLINYSLLVLWRFQNTSSRSENLRDRVHETSPSETLWPFGQLTSSSASTRVGSVVALSLFLPVGQTCFEISSFRRKKAYLFCIKSTQKARKTSQTKTTNIVIDHARNNSELSSRSSKNCSSTDSLLFFPQDYHRLEQLRTRDI